MHAQRVADVRSDLQLHWLAEHRPGKENNCEKS
jgi:hypothetical protein